jgi:hypothetical protein
MRKYSKMDKRAKDTLVGSPGENGGQKDKKKDLHSRTGGTRRRGKPSKGWAEEVERLNLKVERDLQVLGVRRWRDLVTGKNGGALFDRPKSTAGCSTNGRSYHLCIV